MSNKELIVALNDLATNLTDLGSVEVDLSRARIELKSAQETLVSVRKELADATAGLTAAQKKNVIAFDESIYAKNQELNDVKRRAAEAKQELDSVNIDLKWTREQHEQVEASLASLRKKFG